MERKGWRRTDFGSFTVEDAMYFRRELHASAISSLVGLRIVGLGYGISSFTGWVTAEGGVWVGREVIAELQQSATAAGFEVIAPNASFSKVCGEGKLDLIVAFDVVEHLETST